MGKRNNSNRSSKRRRHRAAGPHSNRFGTPPRSPSAKTRHEAKQREAGHARSASRRVGARNEQSGPVSVGPGFLRSPRADGVCAMWMNLRFDAEKFAAFAAEDGSLCLPILDDHRGDAAFPVLDVHSTGALSELLVVSGDGVVSDADDELVVDFFRRRVGVGDPAFAHIIAEQLLPVPQTGHPGIGSRTVHRWTYQACEPAADGTRMFLATGKHGEQTFLVIDAAGEATDACYLDESESETSRAFWLRRRQARDPYALLDADLMRFLGANS